MSKPPACTNYIASASAESLATIASTTTPRDINKPPSLARTYLQTTMFIPILTNLFKRIPYSTIYVRKSGLSARKGGGGGGRGSSGSHGGSTGHKPSSGSGGSGSSGKSSGSTKSIPITTSGKSHTATTYGSGGGKISTIPSGSPFEGRSEGGGTRTYVYGT